MRRDELRLRVDDAGARYPMVVDPFFQQAKLTASWGSAQNDLGVSVAVSSDGSTIVAGAEGVSDMTGYRQGAAFVFVEPEGGWATTSSFTAKLTASDGAANDLFGVSVRVSSDGSTIVAGAPEAPYNSSSSSAGPGAAYVFVEPEGGWATTSSFTAKLTASDGAAGDFFGNSVGASSDGGAIVTGAPRSRPLPPVPPLSPGLRDLLMLALFMAAMAWAIRRGKQPGVGRWQAAWVPLTAGLVLALALAGCGGGGGGGSSTGTTTSNAGTPAGTYPLTVTGTSGSGSSAVTHSVMLTLTVS